MMKIAISGKSGCGNSSVSKTVAERLGLRLINYTFRTMARERGMSLQEFSQLAETDNTLDRQLDARQLEMAAKGECVLGSRLAVWLLEDADLRVYLTAPVEVRAGRISRREGSDFDSALAETLDRDRRDRARYLKLYGIDNDRYQFVDLVIDTERYSVDQIAEQIAAAAREGSGRHSRD